MAPKFTLTPALTAILASIASGETSRVAKTAEIDALVGNGYIEVNTSDVNDAGAAVRLTEKGTKAAGTATPTAAETPAVSFVIAQNVELPSIRRGGGGRESKYPLKDIPEGGAIFIAAQEGKDAKNMSKQFGSMVAEFNKNNTDRYLTSRTLEDGGAAGFGDAYAGKAGIGIYRRPVSERPVKKTPAAA